MRHIYNFRNTKLDTANLKVLFTLPGDNYCSPFPHSTVSVCLHSVNTEPVKAVQHAFGKRL